MIIHEEQTDEKGRPVAISRRILMKSVVEIFDLQKEGFIRGTLKSMNNDTKVINTKKWRFFLFLNILILYIKGDDRSSRSTVFTLLENKLAVLSTDIDMFRTCLEKITKEIEREIVFTVNDTKID